MYVICTYIYIPVYRYIHDIIHWLYIIYYNNILYTCSNLLVQKQQEATMPNILTKFISLNYVVANTVAKKIVTTKSKKSIFSFFQQFIYRSTFNRLLLYFSIFAVGGIGAVIYNIPSRDPKTGKRLFKKGAVINEVIRSFLFTMRKSKLILSMVSSAAIFTFFAGNQLRRFNIKISSVGLFTSWFAAVWGLAYYFLYVESPNLRFQRTPWNVHIVEKSKLAKFRFEPCFWLLNNHTQTLIGFVLGHLEWWLFEPVRYRRETIKAYDGNDLLLDWIEHPDDEFEEDESDDEDDIKINIKIKKRRSSRMSIKQHNALPIVVIIHGLGDNNKTPYVKRLARACHRSGWRVVAYSYWRCDFGCTKDLTYVMQHLNNEYPESPIVGCAFSAGGHLLLRYLEDVGRKTPMICALTFSGAFELKKTIENVQKNELASYGMYLTSQLRVCFERHMQNDRRFRPTLDRQGNVIAPAMLDPTRVKKRVYDKGAVGGVLRGNAQSEYDRFLYEIDNYSGKNKNDQGGEYKFLKQTRGHYRKTAASEISKIKITTLILHSDDDPIVAGSLIDWNEIPENKNVIILNTKRGGHCSWYEGLFPIGDCWCDRVAKRFISSVLESHSHTNFLVDVIRRSLKAQPDLNHSISMDTLARISSSVNLQTHAAPTIRRNRSGSFSSLIEGKTD